VVDVGYASGVPSTPPSGASSPTVAAHTDYSETLAEHDLDDEGEYVPEEMSESRKMAAKKGGYDSRVQQILYENPNLDIQIVAAGKNTEGGGGYISYTIRTGVCCLLPMGILGRPLKDCPFRMETLSKSCLPS